MDATNRRMYAVSGLLLGGSLVAMYYLQLWTASVVLYLGVTVVIGTVLLSLSQTAFIATLQSHVDAHVADEFSTSKDIDALWTDLQEWEKEDPRNTELVWRSSQTHVSVLPLPPDDPVYSLCSIATPQQETDEEMHIVVEAQTGYILLHSVIDDEYTFDPKQPFKNVPFVQEYRRRMMLEVMERREVKQTLQNLAQGKLPGSYNVTAPDAQTQQVVDAATQQSQPDPVEADKSDADRRD